MRQPDLQQDGTHQGTLERDVGRLRIPEQHARWTDIFLEKARQLGIVNPGVASAVAKIMNTK
jgi:hypothetical protein